MKKFIFSYRYHFIYAAIFCLYEVASVAVVTGSVGRIRNYLCHYLINLFLFYVHSGFTLPKISKLDNFRKLLTFLILSFQILIYLVISYLLDAVLGEKTISIYNMLKMNWSFVFSTVWRAIYFMVFATTYYYFQRYRQQQKRNLEYERFIGREEVSKKQLELELADAKNAYLRAQVNPHFLMNTLTFIYNKTYKSEPHSAQAVFYLSKLLRHVIKAENGPQKTRLEGEIEQAENLLQLCRIKDNEIFVDFEYNQQIEEIEIIPLVLLSLVENMVKHGNLSDPEHPGRISLTIFRNELIIKTANLINTGINDTGLHTGLKNISQRLAHNYQRAANLKYYKTENNYFIAQVKLPLEHFD